MKLQILPLLFISTLFFSGCAHQKKLNASKLLQEAQSALKSAHYDKAFALYTQAEKEEHTPLLQFTLGLFYQLGWGRTIDVAAACQWFEKSAAGGIPLAQHYTGICLEQGLHRPADPGAAAVWFQKAAEAGHIQSYCNLGKLYMTGTGVAKEPKKALELCYPVANQGVALAQLQMGKFYLEGDNSIQNLKQAYEWFQMAAQKNQSAAFYYLGVIVNKGLFKGHTPLMARNMFEQAAARHYVPAYFQTGYLYVNAEPQPQTKQLSAENLAKAYLWLSVATKQSKQPLELIEAKKILKQILAVMPKTWLPELNHKITLHLQEHHQAPFSYTNRNEKPINLPTH